MLEHEMKMNEIRELNQQKMETQKERELRRQQELELKHREVLIIKIMSFNWKKSINKLILNKLSKKSRKDKWNLRKKESSSRRKKKISAEPWKCIKESRKEPNKNKKKFLREHRRPGERKKIAKPSKKILRKWLNKSN